MHINVLSSQDLLKPKKKTVKVNAHFADTHLRSMKVQSSSRKLAKLFGKAVTVNRLGGFRSYLIVDSSIDLWL